MQSRKFEIAMRVMVAFFCVATAGYIVLSPYLPRVYPSLTAYVQEHPEEDPRPVFRYEVKYGNTTWLLYDPMVPTDEEKPIEERAVEAVVEHAQQNNADLPEGFEKEIRIVRLIET